ncbi:Cytochrome bo(3) ubiquinol oxidase subunit 2 [Buchnera aphidicola (Cinara pseudotaxifoliae)]|uniref:Ubiquinol oxidase subunit 2 n=1 Tax=Buchnera aphidicola (Cinara pseudotaxifoliae) TaxID=655384 RepID=A0A451DHI9_9GAMM|nr:ubiquinol oxidase subunit II [Buchnera aphidicola]VFP86099.1 Cytochrome bo(3) ubiquinol oxidase subunit 2 [Buchnera aphidicola (Cinara pseudotaxifoliae)]
MKIFNKYNIFKILTMFFIGFLSLLLFYLSKNIHVCASGYILKNELQLALLVFRVMLIIVVPVIFLIIIIAFYYRQSNIFSDYTPDWSHSYLFETVCWLVPIAIILFLANLSWLTTHKLDPSKPLRVNFNKPITIEVISFNWRWLFIYPYYKIATFNEISFPKNFPIHFKMTSQSIMNSFFIPHLGSQIYTMAGMQTDLYLIANASGVYKGISSNYSGFGFSDMKFKVYVQNNIQDFNAWIKKVRSHHRMFFFKEQFLCLSRNNMKNYTQYFSYVDPFLFYKIKNIFNQLHK